MSGYVASFFEQYTGEQPNVCTTSPELSTLTDCALIVLVGVVILSLSFEKKHKVPTK